jgi:hypothetical protein
METLETYGNCKPAVVNDDLSRPQLKLVRLLNFGSEGWDNHG